MNKIVIVALIFVSAFGNLDCSALDGIWRGQLQIGQNKLPLVFNFSKAENGLTQCSIDSPLQGVKGLPSEVAYCDADSIALQINSIGAAYSGKIKDNTITGTFTQRGMSFPLELAPETPIEERRPQTPRPPYPYSVIDTTFVLADGTVLAGSITMPDSTVGNGVAVVLVTGSGAQNRDEEIFDHKPFAVIADFLARHGIASLRYDDRGVAESGGDFKTADIATFKSDAEAAVNFLRNLNGIGKVGVIGHSEGGTIGLMLASEPSVDFAICLAGAIVKGKDLILAQNRRMLNQLSLPTKQADDAMILISKVFDDIIEGKSSSEIDMNKYVGDLNLDIPPVVISSIRQNLAAMTGSYYKQLLSLNPSEWLGKIKVPVFALNGNLDTQVTSKDNLEVLSQSLPKANVKEYSGLNHLFQHAKSGDVSEYSEITETISPEVLADIVQFITTLR